MYQKLWSDGTRRIAAAAAGAATPFSALAPVSETTTPRAAAHAADPITPQHKMAPTKEASNAWTSEPANAVRPQSFGDAAHERPNDECCISIEIDNQPIASRAPMSTKVDS